MTGRATGRGGGWVLAQFVLMAVIVAAAFLPPQWPTAVQAILRVVGIVLVVTGLGLAVAAMRAMGQAFTAFPAPSSAGTLVDSGPFGIVRHPIYAGGLLVFAGIGLATSVPALIGAAVLAVLWVGKLRVEERQLRARYAGYEAYAKAVRFRLVPGLYRASPRTARAKHGRQRSRASLRIWMLRAPRPASRRSSSTPPPQPALRTLSAARSVRSSSRWSSSATAPLSSCSFRETGGPTQGRWHGSLPCDA